MTCRVIILIMLIVTSCGFSPAQQAQQPKLTKAEEEVRKLEREWLDAYEQNDSGAMERIVADDFTITFPNGAMQTKPQLMAMVKSPRRAGQPRMRFYTEDVRSRAYGGTVILTGRVVTEYERDGKTVREQSRYTDTYVLRGGRWQVVASHLSNVEEAKRPGAEK
jgi:ketosteroid isomerase-like protein